MKLAKHKVTPLDASQGSRCEAIRSGRRCDGWAVALATYQTRNEGEASKRVCPVCVNVAVMQDGNPNS